MDRDEPLAEDELLYAILEAVADREGIEPMDLPPLGEIVDVDALQQLLRPKYDAVVTFCFAGYRVRTESDGTVSVVGEADTASK